MRIEDKLGVQTPTQLDEDSITEIIDHLPAISNSRFKCVSKQWFFLNSEALKRKSQSSTMSGIFYATKKLNGKVTVEYAKIQKDQNENSSIDGTLSFLPKTTYMRIYDSCGGLLLCGGLEQRDPSMFMSCYNKSYCFYVSNPTTRKWVKIPCFHSQRVCVAILDFNPLASIYFKVIRIKICNSQYGPYDFGVFSSETGKWKVSQVTMIPSSILLFKGLVFGINWKRTDICGFDMEGNMCRRFDLPGISHHQNDDISFFSCLGKSGGYLHFYYSTNGDVHVWKLVDYESGSWVLKNSFYNIGPKEKKVRIMFHPDKDDVVFVGIGNRWHSYDVHAAQMVEICSEVVACSFFPYSPCYL